MKSHLLQSTIESGVVVVISGVVVVVAWVVVVVVAWVVVVASVVVVGGAVVHSPSQVNSSQMMVFTMFTLLYDVDYSLEFVQDNGSNTLNDKVFYIFIPIN